MRRGQGRSLPERRSARLTRTRRRLESERQGEARAPGTYSAFGSEEELVVVNYQENPFSTHDPDQRLTLGPSSLGRGGGTEGTISTTSSSDNNEMPTTTRLKYSRFLGDGSQDVDDWFCEFESTTLANQEDNEAKARIFQGLLKGEALKWYQDVPKFTRSSWD